MTAALDGTPWVYVETPRSRLRIEDRRPQTPTSQAAQFPSDNNPHHLTVPSPNGALFQRARRSGISNLNPIPASATLSPASSSSRPQSIIQSPERHDQFRSESRNGNQYTQPLANSEAQTSTWSFPTGRNSYLNPITANASSIWQPSYDNNQGAQSSTQPSNSTQNSHSFPFINPITGQPVSRRKRRRTKARNAAAREARQQQQNIQTQPEHWPIPYARQSPDQPQTSPQAQMGAEGRASNGAPQVLEPGRSSTAPRLGPEWARMLSDRGQPRHKNWVSLTDAIQSSSNCFVAPVMLSGWGYTPEQTHRTQAYEASSTQLRQDHPPYARMTTSRSSWNSSRYDVESDARLETRVSTFPAVGYRYLPATHLDQNAQSQIPEPRAHSPCAPCAICLDVPDEYSGLRPTANCTHAPTVCAPCLEQYISHAVLTQGLTVMTCPDPECRMMMEYADVVRGAKNNRACLERYETLLLRKALEDDPNFVWCKNPQCDWGQIHESGAAAPIVVCQICQARSCFTHDMPWHAGLTCEQYTAQQAERDAQDRASQTYIDRNAKICPNPSCGRRIEKVDGCDHMTCRRPAGCGHEFCWLCLADYDPIRRDGNHNHNPSCRHYAASGRLTPPTPPTPLIPFTPPIRVRDVRSLYEDHRPPTPYAWPRALHVPY